MKTLLTGENIYSTPIRSYRMEDTLVTQMRVLFNKTAYDKGRALNSRSNSIDLDDGEIVKRAIRETLTTGKVGSLQVDPNYLDFEVFSGK